MAGGRALGSMPAAGTFLLKVTREAARSPLLLLFPVCPFTPGSQGGGRPGASLGERPREQATLPDSHPHGVAGVR